MANYSALNLCFLKSAYYTLLLMGNTSRKETTNKQDNQTKQNKLRKEKILKQQNKKSSNDSINILHRK